LCPADRQLRSNLSNDSHRRIRNTCLLAGEDYGTRRLSIGRAFEPIGGRARALKSAVEKWNFMPTQIVAVTADSRDDAGRRWVTSGEAVVLYIAFVKFGLHLFAGRHYGYFVDELYYLACSEHLDWGYVDQPPLIAVLTKVVRLLLGDTLPAIRLLPAMAGAGTVLLAGLMARELGGRRFAQGLAALAVLVAPGFLSIDNLMTMNAFEPLFWGGCAYVLIRIIRRGDQKLWLWFGVLAGFGLLNKHSMLILGFGIVVGLLLTPERRFLQSPWAWSGAAIAFVIFLPNLLWNVQHHFPFLELQANIRSEGRNVQIPPLKFLGELTLTMLPLTLPIWLAGLWHFLFSEKGRAFRALGWACVVIIAVIMVLNPRVYYVFPTLPILFAAGGVVWEIWLERPRLRWVKKVYAAAMISVSAVFLPFAIPVLPVESYIRYSEWMHFQPPRIETHTLGPLPQLYADQFGWEEMVVTVANVYNNLPPPVRAKTAIFGQNYGQAGAVDLFGSKYGLPKAISGHQNYFLWGPRDYTGESVIVMRGKQEELEGWYANVEKVAAVNHPYSMPYEHFDVFYCRNLKWPLKDVWPKVKNWN